MTGEPPKLSIIIVNWNSTEFLIDCLESLFREDLSLSYEIIVVDNASTDNIASIIDGYTGILFIQNHSNTGFAKANNQAIERAKGEYLLLLNPDTLIRESGTLKEWVSFMDDYPAAGASGCKLVYPDGRHQVGDAGFRPTIGSAFNFAFFLSRIPPFFCKGLFLADLKMDKEMEVDWICGADFLVRKSILCETGLLDESIFMYSEDVEWGCRIKSYGHKIYYLPYLQITHLQGASLRKSNIQQKVSLSWLENLRSLYIFYHNKQPTIFYDLILTSAFFLRASVYIVAYFATLNGDLRKKSSQMWAYCCSSARHIIGDKVLKTN